MKSSQPLKCMASSILRALLGIVARLMIAAGTNATDGGICGPYSTVLYCNARQPSGATCYQGSLQVIQRQ